MEDVFNKKIEFIEWFLSTNKLAVGAEWLLRKILSGELIKRVHFIENIKHKKCYVIMTTCDYDDIKNDDCYCYINDEKLSHRNFIAYMTEHNTENFYIQLRYKNVEISTMLKIVLSNDYETFQDVFIEIFLKNNIAKIELEKLKKKVDEALQEKDEIKFIQISKLINNILEKNPLL